MSILGEEMHELCRELFPICRSITGDGFRQSLAILQKHVPDMRAVEVPTGTKCFDWEVPKEWNIKNAYIITPSGNKICDFKQSNLHVVGYSAPINNSITLDELQEHLYSLPEQPDAIPYITSYYKERWGFCITQKEREQLTPGEYQVFIDSELKNGSLTYGELIILGDSKKEIFISTYLCHPSMANNELSGPVVSTFLAKWIKSLENRKYTYRIIIIPETIGSITYLSRNYQSLKRNVVAGFNVTCIGDDRAYSYLPSRQANTLSDKAALHTLKHLHSDFITYSFLVRGSDERQYCSIGVDLPVVTVARTLYWHYPEYHTSLDDLTVITPEGLGGGYMAIRRCIECLEENVVMITTMPCEPQLGKRGLFPTLSKGKGSTATVLGKLTAMDLLNLWAYCDGDNDLLSVASKINVPLWDLLPAIKVLNEQDLLISKV